jgi:hypothetical protein
MVHTGYNTYQAKYGLGNTNIKVILGIIKYILVLGIFCIIRGLGLQLGLLQLFLLVFSTTSCRISASGRS